MLEARSRQAQPGVGNRGYAGVAHQRQDGVVKRRGGNLNSAAVERGLVRRQDASQEFFLFADHQPLIFQSEVTPLLDKSANLRLLLEEFIHPGNLRKHLEVSDVAIGKAPARVGMGRMKLSRQLLITGIPSDHVLFVCLKEILSGKLLFSMAEFGHWSGSHFQKRIESRARCVVLNLVDERGNQIEGLMDFRELIQ